MKKVLLLIFFLSLAFQAFAHEPGHEHMKAGEECKGMDCCKDMMANKEKMMADMKAMDAKLDELVASMNSAASDKKVEAMSALLNEMVSQRRKMQGMMMGMHHPMNHAMMSGCSDHAEKKEGEMACCASSKQ